MSIIFTDETGVETEYDVVESTTLGGNTYILVADEEDNARILKEVFSDEDEETASYTEELTDSEYEAVAGVFAELLGDQDITLI
ncbi:MAG TPA: DUF1292 domain-containing protein [Lachnospiraceae bacterium]|nr:DUF1292 domain-containing protein [Lachnospiraceae bacterium]MCR4785962.1 DUF1292 domain-containing protein [Lachnospiraceae bacterium]HAL32316.1 DUF1292 domain-containing protein [Lachnospiraceae bacterium]HBB59900.1 DUF1292 domain-containing protein [Lachnospiraceae bacterium]HCS00390.1 DUF1292 domain-containing protein [Lachnospiraceae bacterium]